MKPAEEPDIKYCNCQSLVPRLSPAARQIHDSEAMAQAGHRDARWKMLGGRFGGHSLHHERPDADAAPSQTHVLIARP